MGTQTSGIFLLKMQSESNDRKYQETQDSILLYKINSLFSSTMSKYKDKKDRSAVPQRDMKIKYERLHHGSKFSF